MEISSGGCSPRIRSDHLKKEGSDEIRLRQTLELELSDIVRYGEVQSMNALDILRETIRILRFNSWAFAYLSCFCCAFV
jgi:hypothetical protein